MAFIAGVLGADVGLPGNVSFFQAINADYATITAANVIDLEDGGVIFLANSVTATNLYTLIRLSADGTFVWASGLSASGGSGTLLYDGTNVYYICATIVGGTTGIAVLAVNATTGAKVWSQGVGTANSNSFFLADLDYAGYLYIAFKESADVICAVRLSCIDGSVNWSTSYSAAANVPRQALYRNGSFWILSRISITTFAVFYGIHWAQINASSGAITKLYTIEDSLNSGNIDPYSMLINPDGTGGLAIFGIASISGSPGNGYDGFVLRVNSSNVVSWLTTIYNVRDLGVTTYAESSGYGGSSAPQLWYDVNTSSYYATLTTRSAHPTSGALVNTAAVAKLGPSGNLISGVLLDSGNRQAVTATTNERSISGPVMVYDGKLIVRTVEREDDPYTTGGILQNSAVIHVLDTDLNHLHAIKVRDAGVPSLTSIAFNFFVYAQSQYVSTSSHIWLGGRQDFYDEVANASGTHAFMCRVPISAPLQNKEYTQILRGISEPLRLTSSENSGLMAGESLGGTRIGGGVPAVSVSQGTGATVSTYGWTITLTSLLPQNLTFYTSKFNA